jgi:hypothetical protein
LFQVSQLPLSRILLFDVSKDLSYFVFERFVASEYFLGRFPSQRINLSIAILVCHEVFDIGLDPVESYPLEVANRIDYLSCFRPE